MSRERNKHNSHSQSTGTSKVTQILMLKKKKKNVFAFQALFVLLMNNICSHIMLNKLRNSNFNIAQSLVVGAMFVSYIIYHTCIMIDYHLTCSIFT